MRLGIFERLVKAVVGVATICALIFSPLVFSQETISSHKSLEVALENAVLCKNDALGVFSGGNFGGGPDDLDTRLQALGVSIVNEEKHGGETIYHFPRNVKVFGYEASEAVFFSASTTIFFVNLRSDSGNFGEINRVLRLAHVPKGNPDGYGYFNEFDTRYIRKLPNGTQIPPYTIFSAIGKRGGRDYVVIGCQNNGG